MMPAYVHKIFLSFPIYNNKKKHTKAAQKSFRTEKTFKTKLKMLQYCQQKIKTTILSTIHLGCVVVGFIGGFVRVARKKIIKSRYRTVFFCCAHPQLTYTHFFLLPGWMWNLFFFVFLLVKHNFIQSIMTSMWQWSNEICFSF
jgi:hypothetical protein